MATIRSKYMVVAGAVVVILAILAVAAISSHPAKSPAFSCAPLDYNYYDANFTEVSNAPAYLSSVLPQYFSDVHYVVCYPGFAVAVYGKGPCGSASAICNVQVNVDNNTAYTRCVVLSDANGHANRWAAAQCSDINAQIHRAMEGNLTTTP